LRGFRVADLPARVLMGAPPLVERRRIAFPKAQNCATLPATTQLQQGFAGVGMGLNAQFALTKILHCRIADASASVLKTVLGRVN
jgi:hypothetical protein